MIKITLYVGLLMLATAINGQNNISQNNASQNNVNQNNTSPINIPANSTSQTTVSPIKHGQNNTGPINISGNSTSQTTVSPIKHGQNNTSQNNKTHLGEATLSSRKIYDQNNKYVQCSISKIPANFEHILFGYYSYNILPFDSNHDQGIYRGSQRKQLYEFTCNNPQNFKLGNNEYQIPDQLISNKASMSTKDESSIGYHIQTLGRLDNEVHQYHIPQGEDNITMFFQNSTVESFRKANKERHYDWHDIVTKYHQIKTFIRSFTINDKIVLTKDFQNATDSLKGKPYNNFKHLYKDYLRTYGLYVFDSFRVGGLISTYEMFDLKLNFVYGGQIHMIKFPLSSSTVRSDDFRKWEKTLWENPAFLEAKFKSIGSLIKDEDIRREVEKARKSIVNRNAYHNFKQLFDMMNVKDFYNYNQFDEIRKFEAQLNKYPNGRGLNYKVVEKLKKDLFKLDLTYQQVKAKYHLKMDRTPFLTTMDHLKCVNQIYVKCGQYLEKDSFPFEYANYENLLEKANYLLNGKDTGDIGQSENMIGLAVTIKKLNLDYSPKKWRMAKCLDTEKDKCNACKKEAHSSLNECRGRYIQNATLLMASIP